LCRFHVAKDWYEKIAKHIRFEGDHLSAYKCWKAIERSKSHEELDVAFGNLSSWCEEESRHTFLGWVQRYTSGGVAARPCLTCTEKKTLASGTRTTLLRQPSVTSSLHGASTLSSTSFWNS